MYFNQVEFGKRLQECRKLKELTQEELAEKVNVSRQSVSKWEGAQSVPDLEKILQLANIFGVMPLSVFQWFVVIMLSAIPLVCSEAGKILSKKTIDIAHPLLI